MGRWQSVYYWDRIAIDVAVRRLVIWPYAPHTRAGAKLPASKLLFTVGAGAATRMGIGKARERGLAP